MPEIPSSAAIENKTLPVTLRPIAFSKTKSAPGTVPTGLSLANTVAPVSAASWLTKVLPCGPAATEHDHKSTCAFVVNTDRNCCNSAAWLGNVVNVRMSWVPRSTSAESPWAMIPRCPIGAPPAMRKPT